MEYNEKNETHTPGPWRVENVPDFGNWGDYGDAILADWVDPENGESSDSRIAELCGGRQRGGYREEIANARLIAAAPELLEALQGVLYYRTGIPDLDSSYVTNCALAKARAAIARATGE